MTKLNIGRCGIDETPIFDLVGNRFVPNSNYTEVVLALSNETIARHGICQKCAANLTIEKIEALVERIKSTWEDEMVGRANMRQFELVKEIKLVAFDKNQKELATRVRDIKRRNHQKKIRKMEVRNLEKK